MKSVGDMILRNSPSFDDLEADDGPVFRAAINQMEKKTVQLKQNLKQLIKAMESVLSANKALNEAERHLFQVAAETNSLEISSNYSKEGLMQICTLRDHYQEQIQNLFLDPLKRLYEKDVKNAVGKKKEFDQVSDEFYSFLSKYLSLKNLDSKKKLDSDSKYLNKKLDFDLHRFDYLSYMQDLHFRKDQEIMYHYSSFLEKNEDFYNQVTNLLSSHKQELCEISEKVAFSTKSISQGLKEREEKRRLLEHKRINEANQMILNELKVTEDPESKFRNIRDLALQGQSEVASLGRKKEGFLFASKSTDNSSLKWKKFWCVLSGGQIHEYSHWKDHVKSHHTIDLKFCTAREARNSDRRFSFEIISPKFQRTYQATSAEEMTSWMNVIGNAISSLLKGNSSKDDLLEDFSQPPNSPFVSDAIGTGETDNGLWEALRQNPSNLECADCRSKDPEWCSINLGILLCIGKLLLIIECSGIHRSLGTHISKIRSLKLDTFSFTPELKTMLLNTGNDVGNAIWEANSIVNWEKPQPTDKRDVKARYINAKYVDKLFRIN